MIPFANSVHRLLPAIPFVLSHYAALIGLAALSYAIGCRATTKYRYESRWERAAVCTSLGLATISYLIFGLSLTHWLYPSAVLAILGVAAIMCAPELSSLARTFGVFVRRSPGRTLGIGIAGLVVFLPYTLLGLYPPDETSFDALMYHLVVAKLYVEHHGFVFAPNVHFSLFPQLNEMLFTLMLMLFDDVAARLISSLTMAVLIIMVFVWGYQFFSRRVGYWASATLLGIPMIIWLGSTAYVDITLTLFVTVAMYSCWNWLQSRAQQWLVLAAVFAGCASGIKFSGLFFVGVIAVIICFHGFRNRQYAAAPLFVAIAVATTAPWYARSVYYTGNPVFPLLSTIFGHGYWSAQDVAESVNGIRNRGVGRSLSAFVSLPWQLAFHPVLFRAFPGYQGPKRFFLLMPLAAPFALIDGRTAFLGAVALSYTIFWFLISQDLRFLVPVFPLIALSMAAALDWILEWQPLVRRWAGHGVVVGIICAVWMYSGWVTAAVALRADGALPATRMQREEYLAHNLPAYPAVKLLNNLKGRHYTLFGLRAAVMTYFVDGTYITPEFGAARSAGILAERGDSHGFYETLRILGADYLLRIEGRDRLQDDTFFQNHFKPIYEHPPVELYEITGTDESR